MNARSIATLALAPTILFLLGCPPPEEREDVDPWDEPAVTEERDVATADFNIEEMRDSGVDGAIRMTSTAQAVELAIVLDDVDERHHGQQFTAVLHRGTCDQPGEQVADLTTVRATHDEGMFDDVLEDDETARDRDPQAQDPQMDRQPRTTAALADTARANVSTQQLQPGQHYLVMIHDMQDQPVACAEFPDDWEQQMRDDDDLM